MLPEMIIALTIYYEAGNQGPQGQEMVASVISQRSENSGRTPEYECRKRKQFSCWNKGTPPIPQDSTAWRNCRFLATHLPKGNGYTHYHTTQVLPYWAKNASDSYLVGSHLFYKKEWLA
jgi:spore germination cell wall hydrolase CwlJ-like protein